MSDQEPPRTQQARAAAELALVRVVHHYGARPEFVLLGGLVPHLLCPDAPLPHAGTTDVDVQVDLEIAGGAVHAAKLENALRNADFAPDDERSWRWVAESGLSRSVIKFELLADLDDQPAGVTVTFDDCEHLGAVNLRGTGYAAQDVQVRRLRAKDGGVWRTAEVNVTRGLDADDALLVLFSRTGYEADLVTAAATRNDVRLVDLEVLYGDKG